MKTIARRLMACILLLTLCLTAFAGCDVPASDGEGSDEAPAKGWVLDHTSRILVPADADEITRKTADMIKAAVLEKAGVSLNQNAEGETLGSSIISLGVNATAEKGTYTAVLDGRTFRITASDSTTLYFAAEAILAAWLTADFGLSQTGVVTLPEERVAEMNGLTLGNQNSIKILSQNVRYADDPNRNTVQLRSKRFMALLDEYQPDLIGAQEFTYSWSVWLTKHTKKAGGTGVLGGYGMVGCSRDGRDATSGESNPIFYRLDRFELLDSDTFWLSETPDVVSKVETSSLNRICTWALLKDKQTGQTIFYANTHLDHTNDQARQDQAELLIPYLLELAGEHPLYLTGDFNCTSDSIAYGTITAKLQDAHKTALTDHSTVKNTYHDYTEEGYSEIDFIFHGDKAMPTRYEIISKPYDGFVSDHYGVIAEFVTK